MKNVISPWNMVVSLSCLSCVLLLVPSLTLAESGKKKPAQPSIEVIGAEPVVPPLTMKMDAVLFTGGTQMLDGINCVNCIFTDVHLTYAGGEFSLTNPQFN